MSEQTPTNISNADFTFKDKYGNTGLVKGTSGSDSTKLNNMVKLMNLMLNTPNSTDFINTLATKQYVDDNQSSSLIPNQIIQSPVPLTDANLHLLDGALLSGLGAYADYVAMMADLYNADPTATCWTDEATWQASVTQYGECGKFVYDSVNNTLRLPKLTSFVQATSTASELGSLVEAGAPNITGTFESRFVYSATTFGVVGKASGAMNYTLSGGSSSIGTVSPSSDRRTDLMSFNASNSNSIYGNSSTIQPQSIKYYFYIVVGTVSKLAIQVDIDQIATDLNGKAGTDLSNVTTPVQAFKDMSMGWGMPDWDNVISLTWGTQYTANFDCIVYVNPSAQNSAFLTINGTTFDINKNTYAIGVFVPIAKGDTFQTIGGNDTPVVKQIPLKGAN